MDFLDDLNNRQREAAETLAGPLLIVAGAGSGKTRALTYRIANLIAQGAAQPWQILAVTFTNKAAEEMRNRTQKLLGENFDFSERNRPMIGTFHSVCVRILRKHFDCFGRDKTFVIYDATDQQGIMKRIIKELQIDDEKISHKIALGMISKIKNQLGTAEDFSATASNFFERQIAEIFEVYEKRLHNNNALDFDDLLLYTVRLFREHPEVLEEYQERWKYINVDEYQDTNHAQYMLTKLLAAKTRNLCVIGDSDQSIYNFRGADITNILNFEKDYPDAKIIKLEQNYRSTQIILDAADAIIDKNKNRPKKKMWTEQKGGDLIEVMHAYNERQEAEFAAREIRRLLTEGVSLSDIVILYRTNAQSRLVEEKFLQEALPYKVVGGVKFYARREIKDVLAYLRVIHNAYDSESLLRIINIPPRRIGQTTINKLQAFALGRSLSLGEMMNHIEMVDNLNDKTKAILSDFWKMVIDWRKAAKNLTVSELIRKVVKDVGFQKYLEDGTEEGEMRYENVQELVSVSAKYDGLDSDIALPSFLEEVALVADTDQIEMGSDKVTMMTLHSVKGLEYPYVFIVGCEEGIFPHSRALSDPTELEEERRLMYVGVTRAMKKLYLLAAKQRMIFGDFQSNPVSRFLGDIPVNLLNGDLNDQFPMTNDQSNSKSEFSNEPDVQASDPKFHDGDRVTHKKYGEGVVVDSRHGIINVAFKDKIYGIKKFAASVAPIKKIEI